MNGTEENDTNDTTDDNNNNNNKPMEIEVEQKFILSSASSVSSIVMKLASLGFERVGPTERFTDWYFDLESPLWCLTPNDYWFRYRDYHSDDDANESSNDKKKKTSEWQLKRRPLSMMRDNNKPAAATVFEEINGEEAIQTVIDFCLTANNAKNETNGFLGAANTEKDNILTKGYGICPSIHMLPQDCGLIPFAKFETRRTSWAIMSAAGIDDSSTSSDHDGLTVDLDGTDFGFMVGEVETIVNEETGIEEAKGRIARLVGEIAGGVDDNDRELMHGKLTTYMMRHRRDQYEACVKAGSIF
eukprot:CAMPEP_0195509826 /NCGR_PEP_ID=MMETSP0794_2-20130614/2651_1 /TAXON_ID=515487 /ORGANISM="Stephanopyxis turris, Strain CCMP 815" /LENGTH=300 /DNA_ID=CAMNT_0040637133 /DNA_START=222 /DNA_END=1124 /DNA_ORIENTATION=+